MGRLCINNEAITQLKKVLTILANKENYKRDGEYPRLIYKFYNEL